jgi:hypothetical protein
MLLMPASKSRRQTNFPRIQVDLVGHITATGAGPPECPACGGDLDLSQPDMNDRTGAHLAGACVDCGRVSWLVGMGELTIAWPLPNSDEMSPEVFRALSA